MSLPTPKPPGFDGNPPPYTPVADLAERCAKAEGHIALLEGKIETDAKSLMQFADEHKAAVKERDEARKQCAAMRELLDPKDVNYPKSDKDFMERFYKVLQMNS